MFDLRAEDLNAHGAFVLVNVELFSALRCITDQTFGRDELRIDHIRSMLFTERAKRGVAHVLHGSEEEGKFPNGYIRDTHHLGTKVAIGL